GVKIVESLSSLLGCIESRIDNRVIADLSLQSQVTQPVFVLLRQILSRPFNCMLGYLIEIARRFDERGLFVMIALHNWAIHLTNARSAFVRVGVVAHDITKTNEMRTFMFVGVLQNGFERLQI